MILNEDLVRQRILVGLSAEEFGGGSGNCLAGFL